MKPCFANSKDEKKEGYTLLESQQGVLQKGLQSDEELMVEYEHLIRQLPLANFKEKLALIEKIEQKGGQHAYDLLTSLLSGELYYLKKDPDILVYAKKYEGDEYQVKELGEESESKLLSKLDLKKIYKKVRTNNRVRKGIKLSIARLSLKSDSESNKINALKAMVLTIDPVTASAIESMYENERSGKVKEMMSIVLAVHTLKTSQDMTAVSSSKVNQAIVLLGDRLEIPVKNTLVEYKGFLEESEIQSDQKSQLLKELNKALTAIEEKNRFYVFVEKLFFGISLGSVLLLAAVGLSITFGVMGVINMAHGEMIMIGAYSTYVVQLIMPNFIGYSLLVAIPAAFLASAIVGIIIQQTVIRHLHGRPLETLLATFGISLLLRQAVRTIFSPLNRQVDQPDWMSGTLEINPVLSLTYNRLYIVAFSILVFIVLVFVIKKTSLGLNVRAVSQNRPMAKAMGVRTEWVDAMTFGLGSGVAGVAGVALSQLTNVGPNLGQAYIIDSFMVVVFGGVGNLLGTLVASFTLGVANKFIEPITGAVLANIVVLIFIILFIQKRPKGLFPQKGRAAE
ncbi:urea ABC transporter permease subunit UrtB [Marinibactrum halimedae]|uniref:urea ABC transporter permease subunit UrtB n=1 Tax=Marinibactrum halimedae TaxID=1444977 RepID=UPI001E5205FD|nr:urea ABC transporter permease subunit UrtB [Marinibactrum halimedae]MCD9460837.1 urea ABC transporter permease subunit UrtB [Marinibactrum halimedae]